MAAVHAQLRPDAPRYERQRPETTLLYQLVERHYPAFVAALGTRGRTLPAYVHDEFEAYLKCGRLEYGFLRVRCTACHAERLVAFSCKRRGFCPSCAARRMTESAALLVRDAEGSYLSAGPGEADGLAAVVGHSITYRIAVGPNEGRKAFTLQTVAPALEAPAGDERLAKHSGFSLHAGVAAAAHQRDKVERLCRYIARPAVATGRLALTAQGLVRYTLKTPYRDGTTHVMLLRASCPPPFGPAFGCPKSLPAILSSRWTLSRAWPHWCPSPGCT